METVHRHLGVITEEASPARVVLSIEVGARHHQPYGIVHGGVYALLAEGAASLGGALNAEPGKLVVGSELNCSHLRPVREGRVAAIATPIRVGRSVQVWGIELRDGSNRLVSVARCSLQVIDAPPASQ